MNEIEMTPEEFQKQFGGQQEVFLSEEQFKAMQGAPASDIPLPAGTGGIAPPSSAIVQEPSDLISWQDRMKVKNLGTPKASLAHLRKQYPNLDIQSTSSGQIIFKEPGERNYKPLDLDLGEGGLTEVAQDVGDVLFDVPAGAAQTAVQTAAAISGGAATGGVGALPASMAAGAGSSAAIEAARQKLGELSGIEDNMSGEDIQSAAMWGGALPLGLGSGATKQAIQKFSPQMKEELAQKILEKGRGGLGRAWDASKGASRYLMEMGSGIPVDVMENFVKKTNYIEEMGKDVRAERKLSDQFLGDFINAIREREQQLGKAAEKTTTSATKLASTEEIKNLIEDEIAKNKGKDTKIAKNYLDDLEEIKKEYLGKASSEEIVPDKILAAELYDIQKEAASKAKYQSNPVKMTRTPLRTDKAQGLLKRIDVLARKSLGEATDGELGVAKAKLSSLKGLREEVGGSFKDAASLNKALMGGDSRYQKFRKDAVKELAEETGIPLGEKMKDIQTIAYLGNPQWRPFSENATTSTSKTLIPLLTGLGAFGASKLVGGPGSSYIGGLLGGLGGAAAVSPKAVSKTLKLQKAGDMIRGKAAPYSLGVGNLWEEMSKKEGEE